LRWAVAGLAVTAVGAAVYSLANHDIMSGNTGNEWSAAFFATAIVAAWLAGVFVRSRREAVAQAARTAAAERQAEQAVADERVRMARELHDIVSHNLSVVVLQAAGVPGRGQPGRRDPGEDRAQRPPGAGGDAKAARRAPSARRACRATRAVPSAGPDRAGHAGRGVRAAGLPVTLVIDGDPTRAGRDGRRGDQAADRA
jgi:hypothetical protein